MDETGSVSLRICLDGHANSLALNKENSCIAVAGRSCKYLFCLGFAQVLLEFCSSFDKAWIRLGSGFDLIFIRFGFI